MELPYPCKAAIDPSINKGYFYNILTKEHMWESPSAAIPKEEKTGVHATVRIEDIKKTADGKAASIVVPTNKAVVLAKPVVLAKMVEDEDDDVRSSPRSQLVFYFLH